MLPTSETEGASVKKDEDEDEDDDDEEEEEPSFCIEMAAERVGGNETVVAVADEDEVEEEEDELELGLAETRNCVSLFTAVFSASS
jgi:hypothetical protein